KTDTNVQNFLKFCGTLELAVHEHSRKRRCGWRCHREFRAAIVRPVVVGSGQANADRKGQSRPGSCLWHGGTQPGQVPDGSVVQWVPHPREKVANYAGSPCAIVLHTQTHTSKVLGDFGSAVRHNRARSYVTPATKKRTQARSASEAHPSLALGACED